jgi:RNA polymerase sigma-70 factor, ECF subfamily
MKPWRIDRRVPGRIAVPNKSDFEKVFKEHFDDIYGYVAFRLTPDREGARDVTQDVFLAALEGWSAYRGKATPLSWLRAIARRKVADYFQAVTRMRALDLKMSSPGEVDQSRQVRAAELSAVLRLLPPECVELLEQKYLEGRSIREIAATSSRTEKAIENALARARSLLRQTYLQLQEQDTHP